MKWLAYSKLAWTESIIVSPEECVEETEYLARLINDNSRIGVKTLLHLGCGAGGNDYTFKRHFKVTGVDTSEDMLEIARKRNPEAIYICGDMRNIKLKESFDAVVIPDNSIGYMTTVTDLRKVITTACRHIKPGGALLIATLVGEDFKENNFVYAGYKGETQVTIFENNYAFENKPTTYEATLVYLIRRRGNLQILTDRHKLGIFPLTTWLSLLAEAGLKVKHIKIEHSYDRFILGEGKYHLRVFACCKPL